LISAVTIPQRRLTPDRLADAMRIALTDLRLHKTGQLLASRVATENGAAHVLSAIESLIHQSA
jgi:hypothetical protein